MAKDDDGENEFEDLMIPRTIGEPVEDEELELSDDDDDDFEDDGEDPRYDALNEELHTLRDTVGQQNRYLQELTTSLLTRQDSGGGDADEDFNLDDLPDPVAERDQFNKALRDKVVNYTSKQANAARNEGSVAALETDLNNRFARDYEDLTGKPSLFKAAVADEIAAMGSSGVNASNAISADRDGFLGKVAKRMRSELGVEDDRGKPAPRKRKSQRGGSARAKTLGQSSRGRTRQRKGKQKAKPEGFIQELRQQQADMGLI